MKAVRGLITALLSLATTFASVSGVQAQIQLQPTPVTGEARMVTYDYDEDRIYKVLVRPKTVTLLQIGRDERVTYVSAGDRSNFVITVPKSREFVEVKPKWENTTTNLLLVTDKRTYHLEIESTGENRKWYTRVSWTHGDAALLDLTKDLEAQEAAQSEPAAATNRAASTDDSTVRSVNPEKLNFAYRIDGETPFTPVQVFDDGSHTWVRMPHKLQELPALFMIPEDSTEIALVNYSPQPPYLVVPRTMKKFLLKIGRAEVTVTRKSESRGWFGTGD